MSEQPQFPPIPDLGEILYRKDRFIERKSTVLKCGECQNKFSREFTPGDYTFKKVTEEECTECHKKNALEIVEIYCEWIDPKKKSKKK